MFEGKSYEGFIEFIKKQDPEKPVDHSRWRTCALGEYLGLDGKGSAREERDRDSKADCWAHGELRKHNHELYDYLNQCGTEQNSYECLQDFLKRQG